MTQTLPTAGNWVQGEITRLQHLHDDLVIRGEQEYAAYLQTCDERDAVDVLLTELSDLRGRC